MSISCEKNLFRDNEKNIALQVKVLRLSVKFKKRHWKGTVNIIFALYERRAEVSYFGKHVILTLTDSRFYKAII